MNCANHPDRERVAFCQNCGKPLCQECTRTVGSAVFCEPCLVARLAGASNPESVGGPAPGEAYPDGAIPGAIPPPPPTDEPNPGLAALLGFIPGVGAMYNGQYAKGIVHLIVFAVLISFAGENGIFVLFVFGWVFYQVIEAYHTAQARRDGTPLPNPFGLNDLGERLGFGKAWPTGAHSNGPGAASAPAAGYAPPAPGYPPYTPPPASSWAWENYAPPVPPVASFTSSPPPPADFNPPPYAGHRFPSGAIWLIALGAIFLIGNFGMFHGAFGHLFVPLLLIGFGVWLFVRKMTDTGPLADDGTAAYKFRLFHALRGSIWIMLVGFLFLLDSSHILPWSRSWPLFIIVAGVMAVLQRAVFTAAAAEPYAYPYTYPPPPAGPPPTASTSVVPPVSSNDHEEEGR